MDTLQVQPAYSSFGRIGAWLSLACAVHCVIEPFLLPLLPLAGIVLPISRTMEMGLMSTSILLALWNFSRGFLAHGNGKLFVILSLALMLMGAGLLAGFQEAWHHAWEASLVAMGALVLATGQFWNRRLHKDCRACAHGHRQPSADPSATQVRSIPADASLSYLHNRNRFSQE